MLSAEDRFAVEQLHAAWLDAELQGHSTALLELCTAAPVWLPANEAPLCGRGAILEWLDNQPEVTVRRIDIDKLAICGLGPFACKVASFRTTLENRGDRVPLIVSGTHGWLLQRDDAAWKIAVAVWTMTATAAA